MASLTKSELEAYGWRSRWTLRAGMRPLKERLSRIHGWCNSSMASSIQRRWIREGEESLKRFMEREK